MDKGIIQSLKEDQKGKEKKKRLLLPIREYTPVVYTLHSHYETISRGKSDGHFETLERLQEE